MLIMKKSIIFWQQNPKQWFQDIVSNKGKAGCQSETSAFSISIMTGSSLYQICLIIILTISTIKISHMIQKQDEEIIEEPMKKVEETQDIQKNRQSQIRTSPEKKEQKEKTSKIQISAEQEIMNIAFGQRKNLNLEKLKTYMKKRKQSFMTRNKILSNFRLQFFQKQRYTKSFLKAIIKYFQEFLDLYRYLLKSLSKFQLKKKPQQQFLYGAIYQSVMELVELNHHQSDHVQKFVDWIEKILISTFQNAEALFKERVKKLSNKIEKADDEYYSCWSKEEKNFEKISSGNDLLEKELVLVEKIKLTNEVTIQRGLNTFQVWQSLLQQQAFLKKIIRDNILEFHQQFSKFQKKSDKGKGIIDYWRKLPQTPNVMQVFSSFLDDKQTEFIGFGSKSKKFGQNFEYFMRMVHEEQRIGNPFPLLEIIVTKKYKSKWQKSEREWEQVRLIFTIDHNLLIFNQKEGKTMMKLKQSTLKAQRLSENIIEVTGIEEGFIIDSNRRIPLHFGTLDEVEEFIFFLNEIPESNTK